VLDLVAADGITDEMGADRCCAGGAPQPSHLAIIAIGTAPFGERHVPASPLPPTLAIVDTECSLIGIGLPGV
jgi:hypothetical protein